MKYSCTSCKTPVTNMEGAARFKCPNCLKHEIVRCPGCRRLGARYACSGCGFEGPN